MKTKNNILKILKPKLLTICISALSTGVVLSSVAQASDIDVYQQAKAGDITLMLLLDISGSMGAVQANSGFSFSDDYGLRDCGTSSQTTLPIDGNGFTSFTNKKAYFITSSTTPSYPRNFCYVATNSASTSVSNTATGCEAQKNSSNTITGYRCYDRLTRLKDGLFDLLQGNSSKGITALSGDKVIGLSAFSNRDSLTGYILTPARRLDCKNDVEGCESIQSTADQRSILLTRIAALTAYNGTPTANAYAEAAAYMMGSTTRGITNSGFSGAFADVNKTNANSNGSKYIAPLSIRNQIAKPDTTICSGQGIYVLTDGYPNNNSRADRLMNKALDGKSSVGSSSDDDGWVSVQSFVTKILTPAENPTDLSFRTAVVGFGSAFSGVPARVPNSTQTQYVNLINASSVASDVKQAAIWGVRGDGGWYSGSNSTDIVNSVNAFLGDLNKGIPSVTTGSPTIARDALNPSVLQTEAYFPQFQPTPDKTYQLWAGNLKKYNVVAGVLKDKNEKLITDTKGQIVDNYDLWAEAISKDATVEAADENTVGSKKFALIGGAKSQLALRTTGTTENRKLLTNRIISSFGTGATFGNSTTLRQVKSTDLIDVDYKNDANRAYLISLLGYKVDATKPAEINLTSAPELRQIGAVMHSSPTLLTNKGTITYTNNVLGSKSREDYVMFGTTQGLLHVVEAVSGKEKFAFVPNEMVENQKNAFLEYDKTTGGTANLFYGIDGPWTTYTEYVVDKVDETTGDSTLTVGTSSLNSEEKGTQLAYGGLRMGGRSYYALDLTNMDDPKLKFQISPADQKVYYNGSSTSFSELQYMGQSWSKPTIAWVKWGKTRKRVMFVGGGYDAGYESNVYNQDNNKGGGVYMFDADTGALLWWASANASVTSATTADTGVMSTKDNNLKYSVVSEIRAEDRNSDGLADHLYFGDLGGQLFRIDLDNTAKTLGLFAKKPKILLNLSTTNGTSPRFYEMPAFSIYDKAGTTFAVISIGSGNRSNPLVDYAVNVAGRYDDAVYNIYDKDVTARDLFTKGSDLTKTVTALSDLGEVTQTNRNDNTTLVAPYTATGWYFKFKSDKIQSAKVFATPRVLNSRMLVTTFDGSKTGLSGSCGAGVKGESFLSQFCMPFGQCTKPTGITIECSSGDGCSIGSGIQDTAIVDDKKCNPATDPKGCKDEGEDKNTPKPDDIANGNYCSSAGPRGATIQGGIVSAGNSQICLVPQRWFEYSNK